MVFVHLHPTFASLMLGPARTRALSGIYAAASSQLSSTLPPTGTNTLPPACPQVSLVSSSSQRDDSSFSLEARELHLFSASGLGGSPDASAMLLSARGVSLVEDATSAALLRLPLEPSSSALQLVQVQRYGARAPACACWASQSLACLDSNLPDHRPAAPLVRREMADVDAAVMHVRMSFLLCPDCATGHPWDA